MIFYYQWQSLMGEGVRTGLEEAELAYEIFDYQPASPEAWEADDRFLSECRAALDKKAYDKAFSINFHPLLSALCEEKGIPYISWIYDAPLHIRDLKPLKNSCNHLYFFDRGEAESYAAQGIKAQYLPLAGYTGMHPGKLPVDKEISLVGQLYQTEYAHYMRPLPDEKKGWFEGILAAQLKVYGGYFLPDLLTPSLMDQLNDVYRRASNGTAGIEARELEYLLACEVTSRERFLALALLSQEHDTHVFGAKSKEGLEKVSFHPYADYYSLMPKVFASSRINLNITLKCIRTGIPLRVFDVLSCGGFLLTNFQAELPEYFEIGKDLVVYQDLEELKYLADYYLKNEDARQMIAESGYQKVKEAYTFAARLKEMLK